MTLNLIETLKTKHTQNTKTHVIFLKMSKIKDKTTFLSKKKKENSVFYSHDIALFIFYVECHTA